MICIFKEWRFIQEYIPGRMSSPDQFFEISEFIFWQPHTMDGPEVHIVRLVPNWLKIGVAIQWTPHFSSRSTAYPTFLYVSFLFPQLFLVIIVCLLKTAYWILYRLFPLPFLSSEGKAVNIFTRAEACRQKLAPRMQKKSEVMRIPIPVPIQPDLLRILPQHNTFFYRVTQARI